MQTMALEVAREKMERRDELKREQDRLEEERENEERGVEKMTLKLPNLMDYAELIGIKRSGRKSWW